MDKIQIKQSNGVVRTIGEYCPEEKIIYVARKKSKHFFREMNAWGFDAWVFSIYYNKGLKEICLWEREADKEYFANADTFKQLGKHLHFKPHRAQIFLHEVYWKPKKETKKKQLKLF